MALKSFATVEQYKRYNRVDNTSSAGSASKNFEGNKTIETDEEIQLYLDSASQTIRNYVGKDFSLSIYTETQYDTIGQRYRTLNPIKEVLSINQSGFDIKPSEVQFYGNMIMSRFLLGGMSIIRYVGGEKEVPSDIVQSTIHLASVLSRKKSRVGVQSITNGDSTTTFQITDLPADIKLILDNYRSWITPGNMIIDREDYNG